MSQRIVSIREKTPHNLVLEYPELELIEETRSPFQQIGVYRHDQLGKILVHDDVVMLVEAYEAAYHEMIAHVPLLHHPEPRRVLVIGGGDGGTSREALRHPEVRELVQVEIDCEVVRLSQKHFPELACSYEDPRMELRIGNGIRYMGDCAAGHHPPFDIILVDSTDPHPGGPAEGLFTEAFYRDCRRALKERGILVVQGETFYGMAHIQQQILGVLKQQFRHCGIYTSAIPFYPLGTWSLIYAAELLRSEWRLRENALQNLARSGRGLHYLNRDIISACFALPNYALRSTGLGLP